MTRQCPSCGFMNRDSARFCSECGHNFPAICPHCGEEVRQKARFCDQCGKPLDAKKDKPIEIETTPSEIPDIIKKKISHINHAVGERRVITVMFADVAGFTALSRIIDAEEISRLMNRCFEIMAREIYQLEGIINKYLGDGLMALFGAPISHEDHAIRAVLSALNIQKALSSLSEETKLKWNREFKLRIGINTGEVVTGKIGNDYQMEYTAMGDTINLASRIESQAEPTTVAISENTYQRVKYFFAVESLGEKRIKGILEPVTVYKVVRQLKRKSAIDLSPSAMLSPFVGREVELETLVKFVELSKKGEGQIAVINASPGLGKSRLLYELKRIIMQQDLVCLEGRCISYGQNIAFLPIIEMTKEYFGIKEEDSAEQIKGKLEESLLELGFSPSDTIPYLMNLYSVPIKAPEFYKQDQEAIGRKTTNILKALVVRGSRDRLLIVSVEDLQWIDNSSEELLSYVASISAHHKVFLVCTCRPAYSIKWTSLQNLNLINLKELTGSNSAKLLRFSLGEKAIHDDLERMILQKSQGNPFFIEEFANALSDSDTLKDTSIPFSIQDLIMSRLDRLNEQTKRIILIASVIGRDFTLGLLNKIEENIEVVKEALNELVNSSMIYEKSFYPEPEYTFKHALIQEVAYRTLLSPQKKEYHSNIARTLEEIYESRIEDKCEKIAFHYENSDDKEKAIQYIVMSGDKAGRIYSQKEAASYYDRAMQLILSQPKYEQNTKRYIDIGVSKLNVMLTFADVNELFDLLCKLEKAANSIKYDSGLAHIHLWFGTAFRIKGEMNKSLEHYAHCQELSKKTNNPELFANAVAQVGFTKTFMEDIDGSIKYLTESIELFDKPQNKTYKAYSIFGLSIINIFRGNKEKAYSLCRQALRDMREVDDLVGISLCMVAHGLLDFFYESPHSAIDLFQKGLKIAEDINNQYGAYYHNGGLLMAYFKSGQIEKAVKTGETVINIFEKISPKLDIYPQSGVAFFYAYLGFSIFVSGNLDLAKEYLQKTIKLAEHTGEPYGKITGRILEAMLEIKQAGGLNENIKAHIEETRAYIRKLHLLVFEPTLDFYIATTCIDIKDIDGFEKHIDLAIENFRKLEMKWDLENALKLKASYLDDK